MAALSAREEEDRQSQGVSVLLGPDPSGPHLQVVPTLAELEQVIERGLPTFREVGTALGVIREARLYLQTHQTFEAYCRERWGFSRQRASQLITAALTTAVDIQSERQARRLRTAGEEKLSAGWDALIAVIDAIKELSSSDAADVAAAVVPRRRAATARKLRKLGIYLGRIAWSLEGMEDRSNGDADRNDQDPPLHRPG